MNNATSLSNIPFLFVCQYISTFSIFFTNIDFMTVDHQNQTVPVINALFQYFNKSTNESEAKNQLLLKVVKKFNIEKKNLTLDMKYVIETYQYIINKSLFHHYRNIYLSGIINRVANGTFSTLINVVQRISDIHVDNLCSARSGSTKLTPLTIGKLLNDFWPTYIQQKVKKILFNILKDNSILNKRFKRQSKDENVNNFDGSDIQQEFQLLLKDTGLLEPSEDSSQQEGYFDDFDFIKYEPKLFSKLMNDLSVDNELSFDPRFGKSFDVAKNMRSKSISDGEADDFYLNAGNVPEYFNQVLNFPEDVGEKSKEFIALDEKDTEVAYLPEQGDLRIGEIITIQKHKTEDNDTNIRESSHGNENSVNLDAIRNDHTYQKTKQLVKMNDDNKRVYKRKQKQNSVKEAEENLLNIPTKQVAEGNKKLLESVGKISAGNGRPSFNSEIGVNKEPLKKMNNEEKSKRMDAIIRAAKLLYSCFPKTAFEVHVITLKGYLLKLEESSTLVPSYNQLAWDFCHSKEKVENYSNWKIPSHELIDDVLFESFHHTPKSFFHIKFVFQSILTKYIGKLDSNDLEIYKNSPLLRKSLRLQDFLLLKIFLQLEKSMLNENSIKRITVALYRLALRECDEEWIGNNNTLYNALFEKKLHAHISRSRKKTNYTFENFEKFSSNLGNFDVRSILFELNLKNMAGVASIDRLFEGYHGRYIIPPGMEFSITNQGYRQILNMSMYYIEMLDKRSKEEKMIDMVKKLHRLLTKNVTSSVNLFQHYAYDV